MSSFNPPKHTLSKSTYMYGVQCARRLWLYKHLKGERDIADTSQISIFQHGTDVGLLAQQLFPGGIDASPENPWSYQKSVINTRRFINSGCEIIYEAAFQFEGMLCAIDILVKKDFKWYAFEVKATNSVKPAHILDASLQYHVITNSGLDLANMSIIHLNKNYIREDSLDIKALFTSQSILNEVIENQPAIDAKSKELLEVLNLKSPPIIEMSEHCNIPYPCDFQGFCSQGINKKETYSAEIVIDKSVVTGFENKLKYPIYYVDFNTWMSAIPLYKGHWSYRSIPFYFSIHKQDSPDSLPEHHYYLADGIDSNASLFYKKLFSILEDKGSIVMYNSNFSFLKHNAYKCNDLDLLQKLENLQSRVLDLVEPFETTGKFYSLEYLLEVLEIPGLQMIQQLREINNSRNASAAFFNLKDESDIMKLATVRSALLRFGESTTFGLVKLLEFLRQKS
jgi:hypothetical protein